MKVKNWIFTVAIFLVSILIVQAQSSTNSTQSAATEKKEKKYQARPGKTQTFGAEAFEVSDKTTLRWLVWLVFLSIAAVLF